MADFYEEEEEMFEELSDELPEGGLGRGGSRERMARVYRVFASTVDAWEAIAPRLRAWIAGSTGEVSSKGLRGKTVVSVRRFSYQLKGNPEEQEWTLIPFLTYLGKNFSDGTFGCLIEYRNPLTLAVEKVDYRRFSKAPFLRWTKTVESFASILAETNPVWDESEVLELLGKSPDEVTSLIRNYALAGGVPKKSDL